MVALGLLAPEIALLMTALAVIIIDLFINDKRWLVAVSIAGLLASMAFSLYLWGQPQQLAMNGALSLDGFALFFKLLFAGIAILIVLASQDYVNKLEHFRGEYYALILIAALGMMLMAAAADLIAVYLALEITALSFYALVGLLKDKKSTEASLKYLLLGGIASATLLYGLALVFGFTGQTHIADVARVIGSTFGSATTSPGLVLGVVLVIAGLGFKVAAVPFQFWVPDVYEGAPTPITLYLSVASKAAGFALLLRLFLTIFSRPLVLSQEWAIILAVIAAIGMTAGNVLAIAQTNIKRMLGYSSIAHAGYILIGVSAAGMLAVAPAALSSTLFYLLAFAVSDLAAFIAIIALTNKTGSDQIADLAGMGSRAPLLAGALALAMISLTGFPPTAGFLAKFYIFSAGVQSGLLWLVVIAAINTAISAFFYLRVVRVMLISKATDTSPVPASSALRTALIIACAGILLLGVLPALGMNWADMSHMLGPFG